MSETNLIDYDTDDQFPEDPGLPKPLTRHEEMLRQDRQRVLRAGIGGSAVALIIVAAATLWTSLFRTPLLPPRIQEFDAPAPAVATSPAPAITPVAVPPKVQAPLGDNAFSTTPKRVRTERIDTKID
jgi:hypothetical protein